MVLMRPLHRFFCEGCSVRQLFLLTLSTEHGEGRRSALTTLEMPWPKMMSISAIRYGLATLFFTTLVCRRRLSLSSALPQLSGRNSKPEPP